MNARGLEVRFGSKYCEETQGCFNVTQKPGRSHRRSLYRKSKDEFKEEAVKRVFCIIKCPNTYGKEFEVFIHELFLS